MAGKKKKKFQPSKYDWVALELEFLAEPTMSVAEFCRQRNISQKTARARAVGWGEKRAGLRASGAKILVRGLKLEWAEAMKTHLNWGAGAIKIALDALIPGTKNGVAVEGLKPATAGEAIRILQIGTQIQRAAIMSGGIVEELEKDKFNEPGEDSESKPNIVIIDLPSNGKEAKGLPAK